MRLSTLASLVAAAAAMVPTAGFARENTVIEIHLTGGRGVELDIASQQLRRGLQDFLDGMPSQARSHFEPFEIRIVPGSLDVGRARSRWRQSTTLAVLWGSLGADGETYSAEGSVYIGGANANSRLGQGRGAGDTYFRVEGWVGRGGQRLQMYQLIIGYAILVRAWQSNPNLVGPIAGYLQRHGASMLGGRWGGSACRARIMSAISSIREKVQNGERLQPGRVIDPEQQIYCRT